MCGSVPVTSLRAIQHSPSAWAGFVPKLTTTLTVTETIIPVLTHVAFLRRMFTNPLEYGDAILQHDSGVQILADVSVAFHDALERSVVDSARYFANETQLEQHLLATETFGAYSAHVSVRELVGILPV